MLQKIDLTVRADILRFYEGFGCKIKELQPVLDAISREYRYKSSQKFLPL